MAYYFVILLGTFTRMIAHKLHAYHICYLNGHRRKEENGEDEIGYLVVAS